MPTLAALPLSQLLESIAAKAPTPGGGAVAAVTGALSAATAGMVVAYSLGRKSLAEHEPRLREAERTLATARAAFLRLAEEDAAAYAPLNDLLRLPAGDPRRAAELPQAVRAALVPPRAMLAAAANLARLYEALAPVTNRHLRSDLGVAAVLAEAAARAAAWNVEANLPLVSDEAARAALAEEARHGVADTADRCRRTQAACREPRGPSPSTP